MISSLSTIATFPCRFWFKITMSSLKVAHPMSHGRFRSFSFKKPKLLCDEIQAEQFDLTLANKRQLLQALLNLLHLLLQRLRLLHQLVLPNQRSPRDPAEPLPALVNAGSVLIAGSDMTLTPLQNLRLLQIYQLRWRCKTLRKIRWDLT